MPQAATEQVQLPPGYEDARKVQFATTPRGSAELALPKGYEDAKREQPPAESSAKSTEPPNSAERFTEVTSGFQHPIDEFGRELHGIVQHPGELGKDIAQTIGIPRDFWSHPIQQLKNIGGSGIPGMVFGEHGLIKDPIGLGEHVTGANELSEDVQSRNWKGIPGDIAGGVVNLALLKGPARAAGEQVQGARAALTPLRPRRAPMGAYDENAQSWVPRERPQEIPAAERRAVPITRSPQFDPEAYKAGRLQAIGKEPAPVFPGASQPSVDEFYENRGREIDAMRRQQPDANRLQPIRTTPFAGASSSAAPQGEFALPEIHGEPTPFPKVISRSQAAAAAAPSVRSAAAGDRIPLERRFDPESILDAEGLLHQESGMMAASDRPGRYYDQNELGDYHTQGEQTRDSSLTAGGQWRGVRSGRDMQPFMREHPEWGPDYIQKALRNKDSAAYHKVMEAAIDFLHRGQGIAEDERTAIANESESGDTSFDPERLTPIAAAKTVEPIPETSAHARLAESENHIDIVEAGTGRVIKSFKNTPQGKQIAEQDLPRQEGLLREQSAETDPVKVKYPDPKVRQMVRANGEGIYEAAKGNPETLKAIHDLTRVDLRQMLINIGEDMGQQTVSNSKFAGEGSITRQEAFDRALKKHYTPEQIVQLAKQPIGEPSRLEPIYRVHDTGVDPNEIDVNKHAHATTDLEDARSRIMPFRNQGTPQTISTARGTPGVDYDLHPRENQPAWVKMRHRNLKWEPIK